MHRYGDRACYSSNLHRFSHAKRNPSSETSRSLPKPLVWPSAPPLCSLLFTSRLFVVMFAARTVSRLSRAAKNQQTVVSSHEQRQQTDRQTDVAGQTNWTNERRRHHFDAPPYDDASSSGHSTTVAPCAPLSPSAAICVVQTRDGDVRDRRTKGERTSWLAVARARFRCPSPLAAGGSLQS